MTVKNNNIRKILFWILFWLMVMGSVHAQEASAILEKVDGYRQIADSFTMEMTLYDYKGGQLQDEMRMFGYFIGSDKSVIVVRSGKNKGMKILMKGDDMWINLTGSKRGLRITPMQRLMGQAANGDVAKVSFSRDYEGTVLQQDAARILLELKAKSPGATYQRVLLYIHGGSFRPERAEFFLLSGKHFKTAYYQEFGRFESHEVVSKMKIVDQLNPDLFTIIENGKYRRAQIPEKYFNVTYLPNIEVE